MQRLDHGSCCEIRRSGQGVRVGELQRCQLRRAGVQEAENHVVIGGALGGDQLGGQLFCDPDRAYFAYTKAGQQVGVLTLGLAVATALSAVHARK